MGAYVGASPLGPFTPQARNPIFRTTAGLVTGTAHGPTIGTRARLVVTGWPKGITPGVAEFTVFGNTEPVR